MGSIVVQRRTSWNPHRSWIAPADAGHPPRWLASTEGSHPGTRACEYPPDPPPVEEIIAVMRAAGESPEGVRLRGIIVVVGSGVAIKLLLG